MHDFGDARSNPGRRGARLPALQVWPDTLDAYGRSAQVLTPELLRRLAIDEGRSARDIAALTGFSARTVLTHLHSVGIQTRPGAGSDHDRGRARRASPPDRRG